MAVKFRGGPDADFSIFEDADIYFQYWRTRMFRIMWMQTSGQDVDFLLFTDADICFQYLRMQVLMLKIMRISADADIRSTSCKVLPQKGGIGEIPTAKSGQFHAHLMTAVGHL